MGCLWGSVCVMIKFETQEQVDAVKPNELGVRVYPPGSRFSPNINFVRNSSFGKGSIFYGDFYGDNCSFGDNCEFWGNKEIRSSFGSNCFFGNRCYFINPGIFGRSCIFGDKVRVNGDFGSFCSFGSNCKFDFSQFGHNCNFGNSCLFMDLCSFGDEGKYGSDCKAVNPIWSFLYEPPFITVGSIIFPVSSVDYWSDRLGVKLGKLDTWQEIESKILPLLPELLKRNCWSKSERRVMESWLKK